MKNFFLLIMVFIFAACSNVTIRPQGGGKSNHTPDVSKSVSFFLWGLAPDSVPIVVSDYCNGTEPAQFQAQTTFVDGLLGLVTLGIYSPRSYRIWCN